MAKSSVCPGSRTYESLDQLLDLEKFYCGLSIHPKTVQMASGWPHSMGRTTTDRRTRCCCGGICTINLGMGKLHLPYDKKLPLIIRHAIRRCFHHMHCNTLSHLNHTSQPFFFNPPALNVRAAHSSPNLTSTTRPSTIQFLFHPSSP